MIRFIQQVTILIVLFSTTFLYAQNFQGKVYYQSKMKMREGAKERMDSLKMPEERKKMMLSMIKKMMNKSYILDFNKTESTFKEEEKLDQPSANGMSFRVPNDGVLYKNIAKKYYAKKKESFGKIFLIKDSLKKINWNLEKESKQIGNYLAFKASAMVEKKKSFRRRRSKKEDTKKDTTATKTPEMEKLTVWYTPEIPVSNGPELYQGLPGLILEVNIGRRQLIATKIVLNPKEKVAIAEPKKGKLVSQKEYDKIMKKKFEEMREMYRSNRKKDGGRHMRFGG
jgi:GLPGLI family protein